MRANQKSVLAAFLLLLAALTCMKLPLIAQSNAKKKPVYVIVHGAWGGSWAFRKVDSLMTDQGTIVYRPSLTGQGERVHLASSDVNLSMHIQDVVNMILFEDIRDIILVGHSYGGMVISGVADQLPDRIRKLVYLDAIVPNDGESVMNIMDPQGAGLQKMVQGDYLVPPWVQADTKPPKDVPHPLKTFTEQISLKNEKAKAIPATYILTVDPGKKASEDGFAKPAARAKERGWTVLELRADHNPQWSAVDPLVKMLMDLR
jgi:pimeloyl-ACP methyl ester carboxylesterase